MSQHKHRRDRRRLIKQEILRLGMQAKPHEVVAALAKVGIEVSGALVKRVKLEILQEQSRVTQAAHDISDATRSRNRRRLQKIPQKRPWRK